MTRRGHGWNAFLCVCLGVSGCAKSTTPPAGPTSSVTPTARIKKTTPTGALCDVPSLSRAKFAASAAPSFQLTPASVTLKPGDPGWQLLVDRTGAVNAATDTSSRFTWTVEPAGVVTVDSGGYLEPVGTGEATVTASLAGAKATAKVKVDADSDRGWDFGEDVVPIFTRAGCNTGACHGKGGGQNGFHLSLFGYDPVADHQALTRDAAGRRLSLFNPSQSLMLQKATGLTPHGGGPRFSVRSPEYQTLLSWVAAGAPMHRGTTHGALTRLAVEPNNVRLEEPGTQQVRVIASYADGHQRDVTRLSTVRVNDDSAASIDAKGKVALLRRAETDLIVRYQSQVVSIRLATVINPELKFDFAALPRSNFIDDELIKRLESLKVPPSPPASDSLFLRRVSLDLTGEQPSVEQIRRFMADEDPDKRAKLVDRLLANRDFVRFWRIKLGDLLQISTARLGNGATRYQTWIDARLAENTPWDVIVRTLLTATGKPEDYDGGPANYALDGPDAMTQAEQTAQRFLALRLRCAQCHDHPFDVWTQDDYFGLAACFAKVQRSGGGGGGMMGKTVVRINPEGQVEHIRTKKPAEPRLLNQKRVEVAKDEDPRKALADWITAPDNPYFARAMANWVWAQFFGKGLADPPDDLSRSNPPVHPELLDALGKHFVAHKFDLRDLVRTVVMSRAYGSSSATIPGNERDTRLFSHHLPRPLSAHQMADALAQVTDVVNRYPNRAAGTRAIDVTDPATTSTILETFGRCARTNGCSSVSTPSLSLRQSLLMIGGDVIEGKVSHLNGYLANLLDLQPEPEEIVENLYLRTLCRPPTAEESSHWVAELKQATSMRETAEDLFWALLGSREFAFNH
ncbi:Protein of unknown function [Singulisphaera sp. GP187]|uniref:DUF1549 domain-containing protein n=1 Tax=Singulisphaera sp. GP187 TaxID=1882752 RepID=UPI000926EFFD|nr:DUF1549 domain-containing protein [Singulisphaera sp. GP187]SIO06259.1 Protein of unknown function [Singulisphaera sp. GP187]